MPSWWTTTPPTVSYQPEGQAGVKVSSSALAAPLPVFRGITHWVGPFGTRLLAGVFVWVTPPHVPEWLGSFLLAAFLLVSVAVYHCGTLRPDLF